MSHFCFRVLSERYLTSEIELVRWNPKYDLLSIATKRGDVILQRLFWKKAWQVPSKSASAGTGLNSVSVSSLSWSPEGTHLAIVYSTGKVVFVEIESGRISYHIDGQFANGAPISKWAELKVNGAGNNGSSSRSLASFDDGDELLIPLPLRDKSKATSAATAVGEPLSFDSESQASDSSSLFIVGDSSGLLRLFLNGFFHMANLNLRNFVASGPDKENVALVPVAVDFTPSLDRLAVAICNRSAARSDRELSVAVFKTPLSFNPPEYWIRISRRLSYLSSALRYIASTMQKISDSWEDPVADLDTKLTKYASSKANSSETIGDDFLHMLVFGTASPELEHFLTHTLTDKGLKKLLGSIENSYQNLFNLLGVNLDSAISALYHHLTTLQSLMGDDESTAWTECIQTVASLSLKVTHLYDFAESNARSIGLFVRWLHRCVLTISDENLPSSLSNFSDDDIDTVAKFIQGNFCKPVRPSGDATEASSQFGLEKLGSFLKPDTEITAEFRASDKTKVVIPHRPLDNVSLPDCVKMIRQCVGKVQDRLSATFSHRFVLSGPPVSLLASANLMPEDMLSKNVSLVHDAGKHCFRLVYAVEIDVGQLLITEFSDETAAIVAGWKLFSPTTLVRNVVNLDLYTTEIATALVRERDADEAEWKYFLYQIDAANLRVPSSPSKSLGISANRSHSEPISVPWGVMKNQALNEGQFCLLSVSGSRKVGCVVFACRTRVKLLELEPEDDTTAESSSLAENQSAAMDVENE